MKILVGERVNEDVVDIQEMGNGVVSIFTSSSTSANCAYPGTRR